ncbi:sialoadhesin isoform X1 [Carassius gibelio]|uniref:sialoadhesin isoform X1 n=2 Tax=Carassius gibelio TaxID=101364 RepID=UPI002278E715|nr:sialoadhesin isoform X1 [Carassius gibelio]XP_052432658.1 sialoadhesin isoform X1 [Carassius gibelio]XP_052432659.1 sialoadhesin isoform X1 [Carassius gibelio]XP_052432660.1 sialoadhesin isoform X1 [Carassius gibelio]
MLPEEIPLLLLVLFAGSCMSSKEVLINVPERTETTYEGSSVTIPCSYKKPVDTKYTLLWFKDAIFIKHQTFDGTIVYSNTEERPQSLHYSSRVEYITDATPEKKKGDWIKCDLRITDLRKTDSGKYTFRLISDTRFMSKALSLKVKDNPCKVHIEPSEVKNPVRESEEFTVRCSTLGSCDLNPEWLVHTSGQKQEWTSSSSTDMIIETEEDKEGRKITNLKLSVTWKDDRRILSCRRAKSEDSCQIRNITLSVEYAPKEVKATVSSEDVKEGDSVTLSCTSRGQPDVSFSWFKKETTEKSQQMSDLKLNNVKPEDSGEYYCEAENKHGTQESNIIQIDVKYGPEGVKVQPVNIKDLKEGDELTLKCLVERGNPAVYQFMWYKNSQNQSETSETFIISKVTEEDRGSYQCQADNGIRTEISNNFTVSVKYSPRSIKIEGSTSVKVGTSLTLTCSADAEPQPHTYKWKHTPGLSPVPLSMETGQLNIEKVTIQHAGQYTCDITNTMGTGSHAVKVDVLYPPSNLSLIMQREAREFEVISIICTVQSNPVSHLTVTGPRGNLTYIQNNQRKSTASASNNVTVYLNVTESDAGVYKCNAESQEGKQETKQKLIVFHAPKNVTVSVKGEQRFGSELTLTCEAHADPAPSSYEWKKDFNGQLKTIEQKHEQRLHFLSLEISDSGQYACIAQNSIGKTESPLVEMSVKYPPSNLSLIMQREVREFEVISIICTVQSNPVSHLTVTGPRGNLTYIQNNQRKSTASASNNVTVYLNVTESDAGVHKCNAESQEGKQETKQNLIVFHAPKNVTVSVKGEQRFGSELTLTCEAHADPAPSSYEWKKDFNGQLKTIEQKPEQRLHFLSLEISDSGQYACIAQNSIGKTESPLVEMSVKYPPSNLSLIMQREAREFEVISIICTVQSNPVSHLTVTGPRGNLTYIQNNQRKSTASASNNVTVYLNVTESDAGVYKCNAESQEGKQETKQKLIVFHAPKNVTVSVKGEQTFGSELTLTCEAHADPAPSSYEWKKDFYGQLKTIEQKPEQRLHFLSLEISDSGQYACIAQNSIGKILSPLVEMNVKYPPSNLSLIMQREAREFEVISIICTVQSNPVSHLTVTGPRGNLTYIQNNQGKSTASASNNVTVYLNVTESDAGVYKCNAESQEGKQETKQKLIVFHAPKNVTVSVKGEQTFGSELTLTCEARADTAPSSYEWKKDFNGQLKTIEQKHEQRLHFLSLEISDSGQYACIAQNSIGKTLSPLVEMNVKYVPIIKIVHNMTTLTQWNWEFPVSLTCSADAHPPAEVYNWYREEDNVTVLSEHQNFTVQPQNPGIYYCTAANAIGESRSENIMLFIGSNSLMVCYQITLPIILLLILIVVALFLIRRTIIKARSYQQSGTDNPLCFFPVFLSRSSTMTNLLLLGSRNDTQENLSVEGIPDSGYGRVNQSRPIPNSQDPTRAQDPDPRPKSNIHTVYAAIKLPQMKQRKQSPQQQKTGCMDNGTATSTLNYVTFDFKGQTEPEKRVPEGSAVYAMVSKNKQKMNFQSENPDYENVSSACVQNPPFPNMDGESDTSEEDEVNYSTVSCSAKSAVKEPRHKQKSSSSSSSSSDDEDRTEYSTIKT